MKGSEKVIGELNQALQAELQAIVQYIVHAEMQNNWGYQKLGNYIKKQAIDEMRHAEGLIERILFLNGTPKVDTMPAPKIGGTVREQIVNDRDAEEGAVAMYNNSVRVCVEETDNGSRELFERMVRDEEEHFDWLDTQLDVIEEIGIQNYLQQQAGGAEAKA